MPQNLIPLNVRLKKGVNAAVRDDALRFGKTLEKTVGAILKHFADLPVEYRRKILAGLPAKIKGRPHR